MSEFKNILTDRLKADWQGNMALFYFLILCPAEIFLIYPGTDLALSSSLISSPGWSSILSDRSGAGRREKGGISKSFWSLFYWWDLVGNNTRTMPQTSSAIFSILMKQKRNILGQTSSTASHRAPTSLVLWWMHSSQCFGPIFCKFKNIFYFSHDIFLMVIELPAPLLHVYDSISEHEKLIEANELV